MKHLRIAAAVLALIAFTVLPVSAQEYGIQWLRVAQHQINNTTWTPVSSTVRLNTIVVAVTNAGTSWVIAIKNKEGTAKTIWTATATVGTTTIAMPVGVQMTGGIDVTFSGTAGVADIWLTYR